MTRPRPPIRVCPGCGAPLGLEPCGCQIYRQHCAAKAKHDRRRYVDRKEHR